MYLSLCDELALWCHQVSPDRWHIEQPAFDSAQLPNYTPQVVFPTAHPHVACCGCIHVLPYHSGMAVTPRQILGKSALDPHAKDFVPAAAQVRS